MAKPARKDELGPYPLGLSLDTRARFDRLIGPARPTSETASPDPAGPGPAHGSSSGSAAADPSPEPTTEDLQDAYRQALTEELHVETALARSLLTQALDDHARVRKYSAMIEHLLEQDPIRYVETIRKLELMLETAHRGWLRALEAIRLHRAPASPVVVQAAANAGGHVHVEVSAPRARRRATPPR